MLKIYLDEMNLQIPFLNKYCIEMNKNILRFKKGKIFSVPMDFSAWNAIRLVHGMILAFRLIMSHLSFAISIDSSFSFSVSFIFVFQIHVICSFPFHLFAFDITYRFITNTLALQFLFAALRCAWPCKFLKSILSFLK